MVKDKFYYEALTIYNEVFDAYKDLIINYSYKIYEINKYEKVILVEDCFVVYIGLIDCFLIGHLKKKKITIRFLATPLKCCTQYV